MRPLQEAVHRKAPRKLISGFARGAAGKRALDTYMRDGVRTEGAAAMNREQDACRITFERRETPLLHKARPRRGCAEK